MHYFIDTRYKQRRSNAKTMVYVKFACRPHEAKKWLFYWQKKMIIKFE